MLDHGFEDSISIPKHPNNAMYHEFFQTWDSSSPNKLIFRFIGTNLLGETIHCFSHYDKVTRVEFSRIFNPKVIFQICSKLPALHEVQVTLKPENIALTEFDKEILKTPKAAYNCSFRFLIICISKWSDEDHKILKLDYDNLKLSAIVNYAKLYCSNLSTMYVVSDENEASTKCYKVLAAFREKLHSSFLNKVSIQWDHMHKKLQSSAELHDNTGKTEVHIGKKKSDPSWQPPAQQSAQTKSEQAHPDNGNINYSPSRTFRDPSNFQTISSPTYSEQVPEENKDKSYSVGDSPKGNVIEWGSTHTTNETLGKPETPSLVACISVHSQHSSCFNTQGNFGISGKFEVDEFDYLKQNSLGNANLPHDSLPPTSGDPAERPSSRPLPPPPPPPIISTNHNFFKSNSFDRLSQNPRWDSREGGWYSRNGRGR